MLQPLNPKDSAVLIVEDNPDDAFIVAKALETFGISRVYTAETGEDALTTLARHGCNVVLADYNLPGMNGLRLLERIRQSWPSTRVVLVTCIGDEHVAVTALKAGATDYVTKDERLTSSIIRSLQATLREQLTSEEEEHLTTISKGARKLDVAKEEAAWLLRSFPGARERHADEPPEHDIPPYGEDERTDVANRFARYLVRTWQRFPEPARPEAEGLVRMLMEHEASPAEVLDAFREALNAPLLQGSEPPVSPTVALAGIFALLVEQYQIRESFQALSRVTVRLRPPPAPLPEERDAA